MFGALGSIIIGALIGIVEVAALTHSLQLLVYGKGFLSLPFTLTNILVGAALGTTITGLIINVTDTEIRWLLTIGAFFIAILIGYPAELFGILMLQSALFSLGWIGFLIYLTHFIVLYILAADIYKFHHRR